MDKSLRHYIDELKNISTQEEYAMFQQHLLRKLQYEEYGSEIIQRVMNSGRYLPNHFSDIAEKASMLKAKENLLLILEELVQEGQDELKVSAEPLELYLEYFYLFLEGLKEIIPDKRASLTTENLQKIKIENEYDLQHLLYAVLKPLYKDIRKEVTKDSGVAAVRSDLEIPSLHAVLEAKCTRKSMNVKRLTEELEADIVHYQARIIYFYIYDKEKIIKERDHFQNYFNRIFDGKEVKLFILQPIKM
jgi:hypothetical protein